VKYIDMPLQHASAAVLKRMKRGASGDIFLKLIERIRRTIPGVAIRTSFIVGFPGETDRDFEELCQFVKAAGFDRLGVFSYSDEDTSGSYALDGKVDARTIYNRKRHLMAVQRKIARARNRKLVGSEAGAGVEGLSAETDLLWEGRMATQAPEIDGVTLINDFEGGTASGADAQAAHHRSARLRSGGTLLAGHGGLGRGDRDRHPDRTLCRVETALVRRPRLVSVGARHLGGGRNGPAGGMKDPQFVVVDEVVGQWLALAGARALNWKAWLAAFVLFRLFDIWKPFPVRQLESLPGGVGIVADDLMAGVYAALVLFLAGWFNLY
jgi:hypothetical protein